MGFNWFKRVWVSSCPLFSDPTKDFSKAVKWIRNYICWSLSRGSFQFTWVWLKQPLNFKWENRGNEFPNRIQFPLFFRTPLPNPTSIIFIKRPRGLLGSTRLSSIGTMRVGSIFTQLPCSQRSIPTRIVSSELPPLWGHTTTPLHKTDPVTYYQRTSPCRYVP